MKLPGVVWLAASSAFSDQMSGLPFWLSTIGVVYWTRCVQFTTLVSSTILLTPARCFCSCRMGYEVWHESFAGLPQVHLQWPTPECTIGARHAAGHCGIAYQLVE